MKSDWFLLREDQPGSAAENMAADEWLFQTSHHRRGGFLRLYSWSVPTFSFGVSQVSERAIDREFILRSGCAYVRRITGGKTVLHHHELTYTIVSSEHVFFRDNDLYQSYLLISRVLVNALRSLGVEAYLSAGSTPEMSRSSHPCFSFPTPNEIEVRGKKIIGSAQKRDKVALMQHGSIPFSMDYLLYAGGAHSEAAFIQKSMTTLSDVGDVSLEKLEAAIESCFSDFIGQELKPFDLADMRQDPAFTGLVEKYSSDDWNLHR